MRKIYLFLGVLLVVGIAVIVLGGRTVSAQDPLKMGTVLQRTELVGGHGMDAILVLRDVPPGGASGWHTQSGNEIVYILEGSVVFEAKGKPAVTLKAGECFSTVAGEAHNVKNASTTEPTKALAFYIAKKGTKLEDLSIPVK